MTTREAARARRRISSATRRRGALLCLGIALLLPASVCAAGEPESSGVAEQEALTLYREGVELARKGQWKEAEERFRRVTAIRAAPPALFALGRAQIENGKFATAKKTLERAIQSNDPQYAAIVEQATEQLRLLEQKIPRVEIALPRGVVDAVVRVDGASMGSVTLLELDCCVPHEIGVTAKERRAFTTSVTLRAGERRRLEPILPPMSTPTVAPDGSSAKARDGTAAPDGSRSVVGPLVLGGAGAAATIAGIFVRVAAEDTYANSLSTCSDDPPRCTSNVDVERGNAARDRILVGSVVAGVGIAALAGAGVWWALSGARTPSPRTATVGIGIGFVHGATVAALRGAL